MLSVEIAPRSIAFTAWVLCPPGGSLFPKLRGNDIELNWDTLVRLAARELGLDIEEMLTGPTALAFAMPAEEGGRGDAVGMAKALREFADSNDLLVIKGGLLDDKFLSVDEIIALSKRASRDELLARLAGGLAAPMQQFAALLGAVPSKFAYALQALIDAGRHNHRAALR